MEKRLLGKTGHRSSVAILGGFAFTDTSQQETDALMEQVIEAGVNHIDVAPTYGDAETRLGPWMNRARDRFFLGCKTMERTREGAAIELRESLSRLQVEAFDLYQIHAITSQEELEAALGPGGAIEALLDAREQGLTRYLGITGHGVDIPRLMIQALEKVDFDTVLFPINYIQYTNEEYRTASEELLALCQERRVGTMIIKSIARGEWGEREEKFNTWYRPFETEEQIQKGVNFALSQPVTGICTVGDPTLLPKVLEACRRFTPLPEEEQEALIEEGQGCQPLFT